MSALPDRIADFEQTHLTRLRQWSAMVAPEDLEAVLRALEELEPVTMAITEAATEAPEPIRTRWRTTLDTARGLLTAVEGHLLRVRQESRTALNALDKGRRSLDGYRNTLHRADGDRIDSQG